MPAIILLTMLGILAGCVGALLVAFMTNLKRIKVVAFCLGVAEMALAVFLAIKSTQTPEAAVGAIMLSVLAVLMFSLAAFYDKRFVS